MWLKWLPWRFVVSRLARSRGFVDPIHLLSVVHRFSQPSEVTEPVELVRAGMIFHARGLINSRAIQHNLDWVWPHWVERQFDPADKAFVPRAFSLTHVNLTHRNWTAVGLPDWDWLPIVDPRGLVTPLLDGWSVDAWLLPDEGEPLLPSKLKAEQVEQRLELEPSLWMHTIARQGGAKLEQSVDVMVDDGLPYCRLRVEGELPGPGWLALSIRPANPEGVSFIHQMDYDAAAGRLRVNEQDSVLFESAADRVCMSHYHAGDVLLKLTDDGEPTAADHVDCGVGLATAAVLYRVEGGKARSVTARVPLRESANVEPEATRRGTLVAGQRMDWSSALAGTCECHVPDEWMCFLHDAAVRNLVLHAPGEVYPGPYTYRRFWFRDAAYILEALASVGLFERVKRCIDRFPDHQSVRGYFRSQDGEWDSNGAAIWSIHRWSQLTGEPVPDELAKAVVRGAEWIEHKRTNPSGKKAHAGLLPAGFSAEHLGPNDFYYWDDFWSVAGLRSAAAIEHARGKPIWVEQFERSAASLLQSIDQSLERSETARGKDIIPASPYRRMDAGAIGSIVGSYPLRVWPADDARLMGTIEFLLSKCMVRGGFFQDMIHSGVNPYLTLHMAQVLLRNGDERYWPLVKAVAALASPTGQWPEAVHPGTSGGCMGDGQHIWAAAEWVLMMRAMFVREEDDRLVICSGLPSEWLQAGGEALRYGPTQTPWGPVTLQVTPSESAVTVTWESAWRDEAPEMEVVLAECGRQRVGGDAERVVMERQVTSQQA
ncbi:hypothetical protein ACERK3_15320 [Phycisphaerales bacterium AB-hyl4]|uniref:Uncharacterized protein n=1 Tax=Natronomicrosphaera hydrolytica TaxID=3242702 RepID=A0ABV4U9H3_9BACT